MIYILLNKRLARSLLGTKLRLVAVIGMIFVGVFAGITFGGYAANLEPMYDSVYDDSESSPTSLSNCSARTGSFFPANS